MTAQRPEVRLPPGGSTLERPELPAVPGVGPTSVGWRDVRPVLAFWVASRAALVLFVVVSSGMLGFYATRPARYPGLGPLDRFVWWDSFHYLRIADRGYFPPGVRCCDQAFFPGYPIAIRMVSPLVAGSPMLAGLVVAWVASAVAAVFLWRIAVEATGRRRVGNAAVLFLAVAPYGIFLSAMYTEALFLALALAAWWAATNRRWWLAGALAGAAAGVRINGLFLAAGMLVMYAVQLRAGGRLRPRADALALMIPGLVVAAYFAFLHAATGSWTAWSDAQTIGWHRVLAAPWDGVAARWRAAHGAPATDVLGSGWAELVAAVAGILLCVVLLAMRRWPEATYVGLTVGVMVCSTPLVSVPRDALLWFPGYLLAAELAAAPRWRWFAPLVAALCVPLLAALSLAFADHLWVG